MITIYSERQALHCNIQEVLSGELVPSFEVAERTGIVLQHIKARDLGPVIAPNHFTVDLAARVHSREYLDFLQQAWSLWQAEFPESTQAMPYCLPVRRFRSVCPEHISHSRRLHDNYFNRRVDALIIFTEKGNSQLLSLEKNLYL